VQFIHARFTAVAVGNGVLNEVSPLECHALEKLTEPVAAVPSFAPAGKDVRDEQLYHADAKLEQFLMSVVLKSESDVQFFHASTACVTAGSDVLKEVNAVQSAHVRCAKVKLGIEVTMNDTMLSA
jgi:hypothetical protein